jgi:hypothetical protein
VLLSAYAPSRVIAARVDQNGSIDGAAARVREQVARDSAAEPSPQPPSRLPNCRRETSLSLVKARRGDQPAQPDRALSIIRCAARQWGPCLTSGTVSLLVDAVRFYCDGSLWKELVTTGGGPQVSPESNKPRIQGRRNRVDDPLGYTLR